MKTFGEFYDAVLAPLQNGGQYDSPMFEAKTHMEHWAALVDEEKWKEARAMELDQGLATRFAQDMIEMMRERISGICTEDLYADTLEEARRFRKIIGEVAGEFGFNLAATVSQAVTATEFIGQQTSPDKN